MKVRVFSTLDDGSTCTAWQSTQIAGGRTPDEISSDYNATYFAVYDRADLSGFIGDCPDAPALAVPAFTDEEVFLLFEGSVDVPEPHIAPGFLLAGLPAYLETNRDLQHDNVITAGGATLEVRGTASYYVDWGDGTTTGPHTDPGAPWPDGIVTHIYTDRGTVDVRVIDSWTMSWRYQGGAWSTPFTSELAPVTLSGFDIREYRAVRVAPGS